MLIDVEYIGYNVEGKSRLRGCDINLSYTDPDGTIKIKKYKKSGLKTWYEVTEGNNQTHPRKLNYNGSRVKQRSVPNLNKFDLLEHIWTLSDQDRNEIFAKNRPKLHVVDIEVEITEGFPEPSEATNKITAISIVDEDFNIEVMGLIPLTTFEQSKIQTQITEYFSNFKHDMKFKYTVFGSETQMLHAFLFERVNHMSVMTGWNFINFDWEYIANRFKKLKMKNFASISPTGGLKDHEKRPYHVGIVDYAQIFDKYDKSIAVKENNTLDFVSSQVLGIKKISYSGTLKDLYQDDYPRYIYYAAVDSVLVMLIDKKQKILDLVMSISNTCFISLDKANSPVAITEALLSKSYWDDGKVIARQFSEFDEVSYEGAFVFEPIPGFYKAVASFDFASLYPSIMRQMNISPESFVEKIEKKEIVNARSDKGYIITTNGAKYSKDKDSNLKRVLDHLYAERKRYKGRYMEIQKELDYLKKQL